jgi:hypothetical protein
MKPERIKRNKMTQLIQKAAENTLKIAKVQGVVTVTPSTISIEEIPTKSEAELIEAAFIKGGMKSLDVCDMAEIGMGSGYCVTIAY